MVTREEIESKGMKNGRDYLIMAKVRYKVGDKFYIGDREASVKKIIDEVHFLSDRNECLHTFMFNTSHWQHGKNMIPLEMNYEALEKAENRMRNGEVFQTEIVRTNNMNKYTCFNENLYIYFDRETNAFVMREYLTQESRYDNLLGALRVYTGNTWNGNKELYFVIQDWGETGKSHEQTLVTENYDAILYEGIENDLILTGQRKGSKTDKISLMKKHCAPSQSFLIVKNLHNDCEGYVGETIYEANDFKEISNVMLNIAEAQRKEVEAE